MAASWLTSTGEPFAAPPPSKSQTNSDFIFNTELPALCTPAPLDDAAAFEALFALPELEAPSAPDATSCVDAFFETADMLTLDDLLSDPTTTAATPALTMTTTTTDNARYTTAATTALARPTKRTASQQPRKRAPKQPVPDHKKDAKYFERRRKNNAAARANRELKRAERQQERSRLQQLDAIQMQLLDDVDQLNLELAELTDLVRARLARLN